MRGRSEGLLRLRLPQPRQKNKNRSKIFPTEDKEKAPSNKSTKMKKLVNSWTQRKLKTLSDP